MQASVRIRLSDGTAETLFAGDLIGRTWAAALRLDDPDISEAHAMLSLRGERLWLLALRRRFRVDGESREAIALTEGARVQLAPRILMQVEQVHLPESVMGLEGDGLTRQVLIGTSSLVEDPRPRLVPGRQEGAVAVFWLTDDRWRVRVEDRTVELEPGMAIHGRAGAYRAVEVPIASASQPPTRAEDPGPLRLVCSYDTVQIHRPGAPVVLLGGQLARVVSELASVGQPVAWEELARPHWPQLSDRDALRRRWDGLLIRLRARLREEGLRPDLVLSSGVGLVELVLHEGDRVEDRS